MSLTLLGNIAVAVFLFTLVLLFVVAEDGDAVVVVGVLLVAVVAVERVIL